MTYLLLQNPGHNRVYYKAADKLALSELKIAGERLSCKAYDINIVEIEGVRYLALSSDSDLLDRDLDILSKMRSV